MCDCVVCVSAGPFIGFSYIASATNLTALCLAASSTATWQRTAALLETAQLQHITTLTLLQVSSCSIIQP